MRLVAVNKYKRMASQEEYELRVGVFHHPSLKIQQLCGFLTS
jgi:hypothetical protein